MKVKKLMCMVGCSLAILVMVSGCSKKDDNKVTETTKEEVEVTKNTYNPDDYTVMPNIVGMTVEEAEQKLTSEGINVNIVVEEVFEDAWLKDGEIIKQSPRAQGTVNKKNIKEVELVVNRYKLQEVSEEENILRVGIKSPFDEDWSSDWPEGMDDTIWHPEVINENRELIESKFAKKSFKAGETIDCLQLVKELGGNEEYYELIAIQYMGYVDVTSVDSNWVNEDVVKQKAKNQLEIVEAQHYKGSGLPGVELDDINNIIIKCNEDVTIRTWFEQGSECDYICYEIVE